MCVTAFLRCLIECRDEYKYNVEAVELLIRNHLVNMQQYDLHLAQVRDVGPGGCPPPPGYVGSGSAGGRLPSDLLSHPPPGSPWRTA